MSNTLRRAAVLVPIFTTGEDACLVLTQRPDDMPSHAGQVAFPGGKFDPHRDDSLVATALREAREEIGLDPKEVQVLGALPEVRTMSTGFVVTPFVGRVPAEYDYTPCQREVAAVFRMPLRAYHDPASRVVHRWPYGGGSVNVPGILCDGHIVWGLTLRIIDLLVGSPLLAGVRAGRISAARARKNL